MVKACEVMLVFLVPRAVFDTYMYVFVIRSCGLADGQALLNPDRAFLLFRFR